VTRLGRSTLPLNSKAPEQMTDQLWLMTRIREDTTVSSGFVCTSRLDFGPNSMLVRNLRSKCWHDRALSSGIIRYVHDVHTDKQMD